MPLAFLPDLRLNYADQGTGPAVVFSHALGLDLRMWDAVLPLLPLGLRLIRYDHRGHGGSDVPDPPYAMGAMVRDAERLLDHLGVKDCVFVGLSLGGLVAQGLAVKRLDLVRGMVLSNTAARIGIESQWRARADLVAEQGIAALADATMERWFTRTFRAEGHHLPWRARLLDCNPAGYRGACAAIGGTDFYTPTASLTLPTLVIAGSEDGSTPPDLVRETADLIAGADFQLIRRSGHLPAIDAPETFATALTSFLRRIGHV
ncbi:3-oxoadipate enol-lactonase [Gemmobacter denitrificans]|uniref:3-oxoadipate enol-lactonase n=1 Tax=Gemmobacter denitrificans TaxID=3123040 RepID=A0ABU8BTP2_9RHOB